MYRKKKYSQQSLFTVQVSIMDNLDPNDEIVRLADAVDWDFIDDVYSRNFENTSLRGNPNSYSSRVAFGALMIKQLLGLTDCETVMEIKRSPYWQYFLGFSDFSPKNTFHPSLMVAFRKRFPENFLEEINMHNAAQIIEKWKEQEEESDENRDQDDDHDSDSANGISSHSSAAPTEKKSASKNKGTLKIDATCCPSDVAFPTDLKLLNSSRLWLEKIIDDLYRSSGPLKENTNKPRTYRREARNKYHQFVKHPRIRKTKTMRQAVKEQLGYVKRDLKYIDDYLSKDPDLINCLLPVERQRLETIRIVYSQQKEMYEKKSHVVEDRIISLSQPYIRPIVRGKQKAKVEFGAKLSISVVEGYVFVDRLSFDAYNEGKHEEFVAVIEKYKERFGHYPEKVLADKIYGNRQNRQWCKEHGIYLSAEKLGRRPKDMSSIRKQKKQDISERNEVECKFGNLKRRFGLNLITSKLQETSFTEIYMSIVTMNILRNIQISQA